MFQSQVTPVSQCVCYTQNFLCLTQDLVGALAIQTREEKKLVSGEPFMFNEEQESDGRLDPW